MMAVGFFESAHRMRRSERIMPVAGRPSRAYISAELLYVKFTRKEQTLLPALVLKGKSRNSWEFLRFY